MKFWMAIFSSALLYISSSALAQDASLVQCKRWAEKAEHYKFLRRKGGSGRQMDYWKRKMREYEGKFRENRCSRYGNKLK